FLFKKNKINSFQGTGRIAAAGKVEVARANGRNEALDCKAIVIATGSDIARLRGIDIDEKRIVSSTGALTLGQVRQRLCGPAGGAAQSIEADVVLVAIGRIPFSERLGLESVGVKKDNKGRVIVDEHYATNVPGVYAIGDVIAGPMLAHKAEDEGIAVAEILGGQPGHVNYDVIPNVVYTYPEIASVGKSEDELKAAGAAYNVGKFPFTANGRARINLQTE